jgi:flagellar L-ring protein precursor FlgH
MSACRVLISLCLLLSVASPTTAQSLWREGAMGSSLFTDAKARAVNDIVTILIVESSSSSRTANTKLSESTSRTAGVTKFPTILDPISGKLVAPLVDPILGYQRPSEVFRQQLNLELGAAGAHEGKGNIDRSDKVSGQIAARVVKVLDNGNLVIEGRRAVLVNDDTQIITISGVVRSQDISGSNTVLSSQLADAEVQMVGRGVLAEAQRPGILYRILDWLKFF